MRHVSKHWRDVSPLFQSTHPRGVRRRVISSYRNTCDFNPRTHVGCDADFYHLLYMDEISIHAPTWGATELRKSKGIRCKFQSTHPRGVRPFGEISFTDLTHFNPRTHVGCDKAGICPLLPHIHFNPRTHVGCDSFTLLILLPPCISIHAPTWGATSDHDSDGSDDSISIHAPTWGATRR